MKGPKNFKALTLVEVVTYLAIFAFIFIAIIEFVISLKETNDKALQRGDIQKAQIFIMNHMNLSFDTANFIVSEGSNFNVDQGSLRLESATKVLEYTIIDGRLAFRDNGEYYYLTDPKYIVEKLLFEVINDNDAVPVGVRVTLGLATNDNVNSELTTSFLLR
jgi:hypothetical protein